MKKICRIFDIPRKRKDSTEKDVKKILIAKAWFTLNKMDVIQKYDLPDNLKQRFFWATVEVVLIAWTLIETLESKLDGTYTRMLRDNIHLNHNSMDPSLIFLQTYTNTECILQDTADEQNKTSWVIYWSGHLAMEQDRLITQQLPTLTAYVMTQNASLMTLWPWYRTKMVGMI